MDENMVLDRFRRLHGDYTEDEVQECISYFPQYILYHRNKKEIDGYCTGCKQYLHLEKYCQTPVHGLKWKCPNCSADITFYAGGKVPASRHCVKRNFVILRAIDNELYVRAIEVHQTFSRDAFSEWNGISEYDTDYFMRECCVYWCRSGEAAEWKRLYGGNYSEQLKKCHEPIFTGGFYPDNSYAVIGMDRINDTDLRYIGLDRFVEICTNTKNFVPFMTFICESAKKPAYEKLMKSGFKYLVCDKFTEGNVRLNYRGKTPQKILGLNTDEVKALYGCNASDYRRYLLFRNKVRVSGDFNRRFSLFEKFGDVLQYIISISDITALSHEKVMNYINRQTKGNARKFSEFARDWEDYIDQCRMLEYDIADESISKPSDFQKMHERLSQLIKVKRNEIMTKQFEKLAEMRRELEYLDDRYIVIQPKTVDEIIDEGKALKHCVGGYAQRHAEGKLTIMFLRQKERPNKPYYTIEISNDGKIAQCRGYRNNAKSPKPQKIKDFEKVYQKHLDVVMAERAKRKKPVKKTELKIGA